MNGMDWVEFLRQTEDKMAHLHKAMDEISLKPEYTETVSAMTEVLRDYQLLLEKAREELNESEIRRRDDRRDDREHDRERDRGHEEFE